MSSLPLDSWFLARSHHLPGHVLPPLSLSSPSPALCGSRESPVSNSQRPWKPHASAIAAAAAGSRHGNHEPGKQLSAQASAGFGAAKVSKSKRRSRASTKAPITVLSADAANFRAMVQKLTGIPGSPLALRNAYRVWDAPSSAPAFKASRPPQAVHGVSTLDTSAFLLLHGASSLHQHTKLLSGHSFLPRFPGPPPALQTSQPPAAVSVTPGLVNFPSESESKLRVLFSNSFPEQGNNNLMVQHPRDLSQGSSVALNQEDVKGSSAKDSLHGVFDTQQLKARHTAALENFLMSNDSDSVDLDSFAKALHASSQDSWLSSKTELAHSA